MTQVNYTGDMGWPPTVDDRGAFAGYGLTCSGNVRYQVVSNMANGKGIWNHQGNRYINAPPHPNPFAPGDPNDYRSWLFQGWSGSKNAGNHQTNAEMWGGSAGNPAYDTLDMRFQVSSGTVSAWIRMHASWSWDNSNRAAHWGCPWNTAVNNARTGTTNNIWDNTCFDEIPGETHKPNGAWVRVYDGPWTVPSGTNLTTVQPYVFIQNWQYAAGPYTVTWANLQVTGVSYSMNLSASPSSISVNGGASTITARIFDSNGNPAPDGTTVTWATTLGTVSLPASVTTAGIATTTLTPSLVPGAATVTGTAFCGLSSSVNVGFSEPPKVNAGFLNISMLPTVMNHISQARNLMKEANDLLSQAKAAGGDVGLCEKSIGEAEGLMEKAGKSLTNPIYANNLTLRAIVKLKQAIDCLKGLLG